MVSNKHESNSGGNKFPWASSRHGAELANTVQALTGSPARLPRPAEQRAVDLLGLSKENGFRPIRA